MFAIQHVTTLRYAQPIAIPTQRLMFRPRPRHDLRLLNAALVLSPPARRLRWGQDMFGNTLAIAEFDCVSAELRIQSDLVIELYTQDRPPVEIAHHARHYPFSYSVDELPDLARLMECCYEDPERSVANWARGFAHPVNGKPVETLRMLDNLMHTLKDESHCERRDHGELQAPAVTLRSKRGSCRDLAVLMMEGVRCLGLAARFASGYVYDPSAEEGDPASPVPHARESGALHAWLEVYLPGAGWVDFDPSDAVIGAHHLVCVAVARDAAQVMPVKAEGGREAAEVSVSVRISAHENLTGMPAPLEAAPAQTFVDLAVQPAGIAGKVGTQSAPGSTHH